MRELENLKTEYSNRIVRALSECDSRLYSKLWNGILFWVILYISTYYVICNDGLKVILIVYGSFVSLMILQLIGTAWKWNREVEGLYRLYRKSHSIQDLNAMKDLLDSL
jgi:hypothetical protein